MAKRGRGGGDSGLAGEGEGGKRTRRPRPGRGCAPAIVLGTDKDAAPERLGQALWHFGGSGADDTASRKAAVAAPVLQEPSPALELHRARLVEGFRKHYAKLCKDLLHLEKPPDDSMDRWLLEQLAQPRSSCGGADADPLFPQPQLAVTSRVLLRELLAEVPLRLPTRVYGKWALEVLEKYHASAEEWTRHLGPRGEAVAQDVTALGAWIQANRHEAQTRRKAEECPLRGKIHELRAVGGLSARFQPLVEPLAVQVLNGVHGEAERLVGALRTKASEELSGSAGADVVLQVPQGESINQPAVLKFAGDQLRVSGLHLHKLRSLYTAHHPRTPNDEESWEKSFRRRLYVMLRRYVTFIGLDPSQDGLCGGNMHAAAPERVFAWLRTELGAQCELFASPLNCYFSSFYSAFPDTDACFGSVGSFFDLESLPEGSYEVGPPYTEEVLELTARKLLALLRAAGGAALSFVVFVPDWPGAGGLNLMDGADFQPYRRNHHGGAFLLAEARNHHYVSGVQFFADRGADAEKRYYVVPHGTRIYVFQTDEGAKRWPTTAELERDLLKRLEPPGEPPQAP